MIGHEARSALHLSSAGFAVLLMAVTMLVDVSQADELNLETLSATRMRPLFSPMRRPPPPKERARPAAVVERPPQPPDVVLSAVIIGDDMRVAFLKRAKEAKAFPVRSSGNVDGWTVTAIEPRQLVLENGAQRATIGFPKRAGAASAVTAAATKPAPPSQ